MTATVPPAPRRQPQEPPVDHGMVIVPGQPPRVLGDLSDEELEALAASYGPDFRYGSVADFG